MMLQWRSANAAEISENRPGLSAAVISIAVCSVPIGCADPNMVFFPLLLALVEEFELTLVTPMLYFIVMATVKFYLRFLLI